MIGRRVVLVQETVMNLCHIFRARFLCKFLAQVSGTLVCVAGISVQTIEWYTLYEQCLVG